MGVHGVANPPYLRRFLFSGLPCVAPYCAPGGIRVVSTEHGCFTILLARGTHPKYVWYRARNASIEPTLDRYSHWIPCMGRHAADGMDEALG
jgi:hypothetical protein